MLVDPASGRAGFVMPIFGDTHRPCVISCLVPASQPHSLSLHARRVFVIHGLRVPRSAHMAVVEFWRIAVAFRALVPAQAAQSHPVFRHSLDSQPQGRARHNKPAAANGSKVVCRVFHRFALAVGRAGTFYSATGLPLKRLRACVNPARKESSFSTRILQKKLCCCQTANASHGMLMAIAPIR